jgi:predicted nicotinamide N-methyase
MSNFWEYMKPRLIRALRTVIQAGAGAALAAIGSATTIGAVDWVTVASTAAMAACVSILMSLAGLPEDNKQD